MELNSTEKGTCALILPSIHTSSAVVYRDGLRFSVPVMF